MLGKVLCFAAGAVFGLVITCCFVVAGQDDERSGIK